MGAFLDQLFVAVCVLQTCMHRTVALLRTKRIQDLPTSSSSTMLSSAGHGMVNRAKGTSVEHELSSNTLITGGSFVTVEEGGVFNHQTHTYTHLTTGTEGRSGMRKLGKMIAPGAFHNSAERHDPPKCHPNTRQAVLNKIMEWVQGLEDSERRCFFMWLYGPAGAGKSAIAQTIAELCYELKLLAASFFFSRTAAGRNDHSRLVSTLTYQFCLSIPELRTYVEKAVELDPNIFSLSIETQLRKLIIEPLSHFRDSLSRYHAHIHPMLIIIDGLDECASGIYVQRSVLQILAEQLPVPMFFLVASRPEPHIRDFFTAEPMASITTTIALDNSYLPDVDIKIFLRAKFDAIKRHHPLSHQLPKSWPSAVDVDYLVRKSSGQFIYASTVMKYVESPRHWPTDRLEIIFGIISRGKDTPFADLDALYTHLFSSVEDVNKVLEVFSILLLVKTANVVKRPALIEDLLCLRSDDLKITLIDLHSILDIPSQADAGEIRILHASLGDFLLDQSRSRNYHINPGRAHANLTQRFLRYIPDPQLVTGDRKISILHRLSSAIFTVHCAQSYPTAELLDALWSFDISAFWTLYFRGSWNQTFVDELDSIPPKTSRASRLSDFLTWLKNNGSNKEGQDLYSHYILTWDRHIRDSLTQSPVGPLELQYIVFFILPQFRSNYRAQDIFTILRTGEHYDSLARFSSALSFHDGDSRYDLTLTEFFSDPSRSGPLYVDGTKYASFAITFIKYLINYRWFREDHLSCFSTLLLKASYSQELLALLNSELLGLGGFQRAGLATPAADIIESYCNSHQPALRANDSDAVGEINPSRKKLTQARRGPGRRAGNCLNRLDRWLGTKFRDS